LDDSFKRQIRDNWQSVFIIDIYKLVPQMGRLLFSLLWIARTTDAAPGRHSECAVKQLTFRSRAGSPDILLRVG
jgi:hypothetical protein